MPELLSGAVTRIHPTLPIFRVEDGGDTVFYAPGFSTRAPGHDGLEAAALEAERAWQALASKPFTPECLTVYLSNRCNLGCRYCFAAPAEPTRANSRLRVIRDDEAGADFPILSEAAVAAAARVVARHCARLGKPLTLVLHGGGEPTLHWALLQRVRALVTAIANEHRVASWAYIATHGAISSEQAQWLSEHFDLVGLSCDGPAAIQNANRPFAGGGRTSDLVERTAAILRAARTPFTVRATITPANVWRQADIVRYASRELGAAMVRIEPVYDGRHRHEAHFSRDDAGAFVAGFLDAQAAGLELGCEVGMSGVRGDEIHGPYCNPLRDVLHVTPDGAATACFLSTGEDHGADAPLAMGGFDSASGEFIVDYERASLLRRRATHVPERCHDCLNVYHCARDCPDTCVITVDPSEKQTEGFRCRVQQLVTLERVRQTGGSNER